MSPFEKIRPYNDNEVLPALLELAKHPMFKALLKFTFPDKDKNEIKELLKECDSIHKFQTKIIYHTVQQVIRQSTDGFSTSGFDSLEANASYLYLSNHRDIILDTSFINVALLQHDQIMTASAIGDNLVRKPFLMDISRLNRNFLVQRSLTPREMLKSSLQLSQYVHYCITNTQSVWMAQREGRTKDGNDLTQQGVLKMLAMHRGDMDPISYLQELNITPVAISYEFDPTDKLKVPEIVAKLEDRKYEKEANEDFKSIMHGVLGNKKRVHVAVAKLETKIFEQIKSKKISDNDKLQELAKAIDHTIYKHYKLWPSNFVAYDLYHKTTKYKHAYTEYDKSLFERRMERRIEPKNKVILENFLLMYANPVINKEKIN